MNRRLGILAGAALALLATACGKPADDGRTKIVVMGYRGSGFDESFEKAFIAPYEKANPNVDVQFYGVEDSATELGQLRAQRNAPQVDVVITDISVGNVLKQEGLLHEPQAADLPNAAGLKPLGRELGLTAPPFTYDRLVLIYSKVAFPTAPTSWNALWAPDQAGKVIVPADGGGDIQSLAFTFIINQMQGGAGIDDVTRGVDRIAALAPAVQTWTPQPDQYTLVANGTANLAVGWRARALYRAERAPDRLGVAAPQEGTVAQINVVGVVKGGRQIAEAVKFQNYMLSAEAQGRFATLMHYVPTNGGAAAAEPADGGAVIPINWLDVSARRRAILLQWRQKILAPGGD